MDLALICKRTQAVLLNTFYARERLQEHLKKLAELDKSRVAHANGEPSLDFLCSKLHELSITISASRKRNMSSHRPFCVLATSFSAAHPFRSSDLWYQSVLMEDIFMRASALSVLKQMSLYEAVASACTAWLEVGRTTASTFDFFDELVRVKGVVWKSWTEKNRILLQNYDDPEGRCLRNVLTSRPTITTRVLMLLQNGPTSLKRKGIPPQNPRCLECPRRQKTALNQYDVPILAAMLLYCKGGGYVRPSYVFVANLWRFLRSCEVMTPTSLPGCTPGEFLMFFLVLYAIPRLPQVDVLGTEPLETVNKILHQMGPVKLGTDLHHPLLGGLLSITEEVHITQRLNMAHRVENALQERFTSTLNGFVPDGRTFLWDPEQQGWTSEGLRHRLQSFVNWVPALTRPLYDPNGKVC